MRLELKDAVQMYRFNCGEAQLLYDAFYKLSSEDGYDECPYQFPQELPFKDYDYYSEEEEDGKQ